MDIVTAISKLDAQFKRGMLCAADYAWELQLLASSKIEELRTTYTIVHLADGDYQGRTSEITLSEVREIVRCHMCSVDGQTSCVDCDTDAFISELESTGKAVKVQYESFCTSVITAYKNKD